MKHIQSFFAILTISFLMTSCGDDGGLTLTLNSPNDNTVFTAGDVISIAGTAVYDIEVASVIIESLEIGFTETLIGNGTPSVGFTFDVTLVDGTQPIDDVTIEVTAIDDEGNSVSEERNISIQ